MMYFDDISLSPSGIDLNTEREKDIYIGEL
jgi:hypothetical protein